MNPHTKEMRRNFWMLLIAFFLLIIIGTSNVFSSTFVEDMAEGGSAYGHLIRQGVYLSLGLVPVLFVYKKDYHMWKKWSVRLFVFTVILLVAVLAAGIVVNGARRWLGAGGFTFQPSEIAKLVVILFTADKLAPLWDKKGHIEFFSPLSAFFRPKQGKSRGGNESALCLIRCCCRRFSWASSCSASPMPARLWLFYSCRLLCSG